MSDDSRIRPSFWTFNIGHVLTLVTFLVASISAYYALKTDLTVTSERVVRIEQALEFRVMKMENTIFQLAAGIVDNARQDERIKFIERRVDRLEEPRK